MSMATIAGGRYRVDGVLGHGGMAVVYAAHDGELDRPVAVKVLAENLAEDDDFRRRFLREARIAAGLSHPNLVAVYDAGEDGGRPYLVMELVHGRDLADLLAERGRLDPDEAVDLGVQAAAGLAHVHERGLVHRDVKPHNLLLGAGGVVKVTDFGIARPATATQRLTEVGTVLGTAAYLAPEQAAGDDVTAAADVYALGAVLYLALTGRTPYPAESLGQLLTAQRRGSVTPVRELAPAVPSGLEEVVMRCLARNPDFRPASAAELGRLLGGGESEAPTRLRRAPRRPTRLRAAVAALVVAAAAAGIAVGATSGSGSSPPPLPRDRPGHPAVQARDLAGWLRRASG